LLKCFLHCCLSTPCSDFAVPLCSGHFMCGVDQWQVPKCLIYIWIFIWIFELL
jgi:hypothetical protein